jgi:hypothetical protein
VGKESSKILRIKLSEFSAASGDRTPIPASKSCRTWVSTWAWPSGHAGGLLRSQWTNLFDLDHRAVGPQFPKKHLVVPSSGSRIKTPKDLDYRQGDGRNIRDLWGPDRSNVTTELHLTQTCRGKHASDTAEGWHPYPSQISLHSFSLPDFLDAWTWFPLIVSDFICFFIPTSRIISPVSPLPHTASACETLRALIQRGLEGIDHLTFRETCNKNHQKPLPAYPLI